MKIKSVFLLAGAPEYGIRRIGKELRKLGHPVAFWNTKDGLPAVTADAVIVVFNVVEEEQIEVKQNKRITWNFQPEKIVIEPNIPTLISHAGLTQNSKYTSSLYNSSRLVMTSISSPNRSALRFRSLHFVLDTNQNSELSIK